MVSGSEAASPWRAAMAPLRRYVLVFGGFAAAVGLTLYPIFFYPMTHLGDYKKAQSVNRAGIIQEDVQPPGLKVWSDPFGKK